MKDFEKLTFSNSSKKGYCNVENNVNRNESVKLDGSLRLLFQGSNKCRIDLINGIFGTNLDYRQDTVELNKDFNDSNLDKREADALVEVTMYKKEKHLYHIEFQVKNDKTMGLRMFEYGAKIALQSSFSKSSYEEIVFPRQCVLYFTKKGSAPKSLDLKIKFTKEDCLYNNEIDYRIPCISYFDLSDDEIIRRFKPMIVFKLYEMKYKYNGKNEQKLQSEFIEEFNNIKEVLVKNYENSNLDAIDFGHCLDIINSIGDYVNNKCNLEIDMKKELYTMKSIIDEWREEDKEEGRQEGRQEEIKRNKISIAKSIIRMHLDGIPIDKICKYIDQPREFIERCINNYTNK